MLFKNKYSLITIISKSIFPIVFNRTSRQPKLIVSFFNQLSLLDIFVYSLVFEVFFINTEYFFRGFNKHRLSTVVKLVWFFYIYRIVSCIYKVFRNCGYVWFSQNFFPVKISIFLLTVVFLCRVTKSLLVTRFIEIRSVWTDVHYFWFFKICLAFPQITTLKNLFILRFLWIFKYFLVNILKSIRFQLLIKSQRHF